MTDEFRDAMRGQFDDATVRLAEDPFATANVDVVTGRVRRRRALTNAATAGGSLVAIGAVLFAVINAPFGAASPAASPSACVTSTPAPDPYPVTTVSPDASGLSFAVELPDGGGTLALAFTADGDDALHVTFPDGSSSSVAMQRDHGYYVFSLASGAPVVVTLDASADLQVTIGDEGATVVPATETSTPKVVHSPGAATVECGGESDAMVGSPFECGFVMDDTVHEDDALAIVASGYRTADDVKALSTSLGLTVKNPAAAFGDLVVPFATAVNYEGEGGLAAGLDPATQRPDKQLPVTGVSIVKVENGVVVAVTDLGDSPDGVSRAYGTVTNDGESIYVLDKSFFEACPGVTSTADADFYAVAGSQTWQRYHAGEPARYVWEALHLG